MRILLLAGLVAMLSCKNHQKVADMPENPSGTKNEAVTKGTHTSSNEIKTNQTQNSDSLTRLVVLFYSVASGPEIELINEYIDSIGMYEQNTGKKIDYKRVSWGREGETDVYMQLKELTPPEQADFVTMTRRILSKGKYVNIYENFAYRKKGR